MAFLMKRTCLAYIASLLKWERWLVTLQHVQNAAGKKYIFSILFYNCVDFSVFSFYKCELLIFPVSKSRNIMLKLLVQV